MYMGLRIFLRLNRFGFLTIDGWLMVALEIAYTGSVITESVVYLVFTSFDFIGYLKVCISKVS